MRLSRDSRQPHFDDLSQSMQFMVFPLPPSGGGGNHSKKIAFQRFAL
jgi:hypothetical protein